MSGAIVDQAALRGILCKLWDLNLVLVSVNPVEMDKRSGPGSTCEENTLWPV